MLVSMVVRNPLARNASALATVWGKRVQVVDKARDDVLDRVVGAVLGHLLGQLLVQRLTLLGLRVVGAAAAAVIAVGREGGD